LIRLTPRVNFLVDRRWLARFPFFGLTGAGGAATRLRTHRAGGITTVSAGSIHTARAGGLTTIPGRP